MGAYHDGKVQVPSRLCLQKTCCQTVLDFSLYRKLYLLLQGRPRVLGRPSMFASTRASNGLLRTLLTTPAPTLCRTTLWTQRSAYATVCRQSHRRSEKERERCLCPNIFVTFQDIQAITPGTPSPPTTLNTRPVRRTPRTGSYSRKAQKTAVATGQVGSPADTVEGGHKQRIRLLDFRREQTGCARRGPCRIRPGPFRPTLRY